MTAALKHAVIAALRAVPDGEKPRLGTIRAHVSRALYRDVLAVEIRQALEALYFKGMIDHKLNLSPSMRPPAKPVQPTCETEGALRDPAATSVVRPIRKLIDLRHAPSSMEAMAASWRRKAAGQ